MYNLTIRRIISLSLLCFSIKLLAVEQPLQLENKNFDPNNNNFIQNQQTNEETKTKILEGTLASNAELINTDYTKTPADQKCLCLFLPNVTTRNLVLVLMETLP